jgi:NTP pyrophosphatase (non-canonical NTP hydrolase)
MSYFKKQRAFIEQFNAIQKEAHKIAISKGWWDDHRSDGEIIALIHEEVSEALGALRKGGQPDKHVKNFTNIEVELADIILRIMDFAGHKRFRVIEALLEKMEFNKTRSYRHGKRF